MGGGMGTFSLRSILVEFVSLLYTLSLIMRCQSSTLYAIWIFFGHTHHYIKFIHLHFCPKINIFFADVHLFSTCLAETPITSLFTSHTVVSRGLSEYMMCLCLKVWIYYLSSPKCRAKNIIKAINLWTKKCF